MSRKKLGWLLFGLFCLALVMGPGPGNALINPDPGDSEARRFFLGIPIVYAWAILWYAVQATAVGLAYFKLWRSDVEGETAADIES